MTEPPPAIAFFDLDHTLLRINSSFSYGKLLYQRGILSFGMMSSLLAAYALHELKVLSLERMQRYIFKKIFQGRRFCDFEETLQEFLDHHVLPAVNEAVMQKVQELQQAKAGLFVLSSSPDFLVKKITNVLGIPHFQATPYALDEAGCFSHVPYIFDGHAKAAFAEQLRQQYQLPKECTSAYTDSIRDLPLLLAVGQPVAVNPDKALKKLCFQQQWPTL